MKPISLLVAFSACAITSILYKHLNKSRQQKKYEKTKEKLPEKIELKNDDKDIISLFKEVEAETKTKVILFTDMNLSQEGYIEGVVTVKSDYNDLMRYFLKYKEHNITLILHLYGTKTWICNQIANVIIRHRSRGHKVTVMVPFYAKSGGTIIALSADEIHCSEVTTFSPIDSQTNYKGEKISVMCVEKFLQKDRKGKLKNEFLDMLGSDIIRYSKDNRAMLEQMLESHKRKQTVLMEDAESLLLLKHSHAWPLTLSHFEEIGFKIFKLGISKKIIELVETCTFQHKTKTEYHACDSDSDSDSDDD